MSKKKSLCCESSLGMDEKMFGTAPRVDVWFLVEYRGRWSGSAYKDSRIPKKVKSYLNKALKSVPNSRLQLIKKHENPDEELRFYLAVSKESGPRLYEFKFKNYKDLLTLNIKKILKSDKNITYEKIYIICTNGEYDRCCGKYGMPLYLEITKGKYGANTWETNHIGGHRFAPTFVCLPDGVVYGRVREAEGAEGLMNQIEEGKVDIEYFRGRSCHSSEVQASEYYLRKETGIDEISEFVFRNSKKGNKKYSVSFKSRSDDKKHRVKISQERKAVKVLKSCGDGDSFVPQYALSGRKSA